MDDTDDNPDDEPQLQQRFRFWGNLPGYVSNAQFAWGRDFHYWDKLPYDLKMEILNYLNFASLMNFRAVSKQSHLLASKCKPVGAVRPTAASLNFVDPVDKTFNIKNSLQLSVKWSGYENEDYRSIFTPSRNHSCIVEMIRTKKGAEICERIHYEQDQYTTALRFFFQLLEHLDIVTMKIFMTGYKFSHILKKLNCNNELECMVLSKEGPCRTSIESLSIHADRGAEPIIAFLRFLNPCQELIISDYSGYYGFLDSKIFDMEAVQKVRRLSVNVKANLRDDQLCKLRAQRLSLSTQGLSSTDLNRFLKQWIDGQRKITYITINGIKRKPFIKEEVFDGVSAVESGINHMIESDQGKILVTLELNRIYITNYTNFASY